MIKLSLWPNESNKHRSWNRNPNSKNHNFNHMTFISFSFKLTEKQATSQTRMKLNIPPHANTYYPNTQIQLCSKHHIIKHQRSNAGTPCKEAKEKHNKWSTFTVKIRFQERTQLKNQRKQEVGSWKGNR